MPEGATGNDSESDLPSPDSGKSYSGVDELKESVTEGASGTAAGQQAEAVEEEGQSPEADSGESDGSETVRMTFHVDRETAERLRNAVYWTATPVTLSGTARDALRAAVRQLEEKHNDGEPFPERDEDLKGGNPNLK